MASAATIKPIVTPVAEEDVLPVATTRLAVGEGDTTDAVLDLDARGDGFTEDVGVGDTGTAVGFTVAVAVVFVRVWVGVGVGVEECVGEEEGVVPMTVMVPCMLEWMLQW